MTTPQHDNTITPYYDITLKEADALIAHFKLQLSTFHNKSYREGQIKALRWFLESKKKISVLCSPTGSGKSLIGIVAGMIHGEFTYLCSSRQLQVQIEREFPEVQVMWGRNNFLCNVFPDLSAAECPYTGIDKTKISSKLTQKIMSCKSDCPYEVKKRKVLESKYRVLNYAYFLTEANFVGKFSGQKIVICDEADTIEDAIAGISRIKISKRLIDKLGINMPAYKTTQAAGWYQAWQNWAEDTKDIVGKYLKKLENIINSYEVGDLDQARVIKEKDTLTGLLWKLDIFIEHMDDSWVFDTVNDYKTGEVVSWEFKPIWVIPKLAEKYFISHGERFLMMSATFPPMTVLAKVLGIDMEDINYLEIESVFKPENRKVYLNPVGDLSYTTFDNDISDVIAEIKKILSKHPKQKGVIHTVSWKLNKIVMGIKNNRLITHDVNDKTEVLERFMMSKEPLVFVSPSSCRGIDLKDDLCLLPGTMIRTSKGYKAIETIKIGDRVWTHKRRYRKVMQIFQRNYNGTIVEIHPYGAPKCYITPNHQILYSKWGKSRSFQLPSGMWVQRKIKCKRVSLDWINAKNVTINEMLCLSIGGTPRSNKKPGAKYITGGNRPPKETNNHVLTQWDDTPEFWKLVGYWAAEGNITKTQLHKVKRCGRGRTHYGVVWSFGSHEKDTLVHDCCQLIHKVLGNKFPKPTIHGSGCIISIKNDAFATWLKRNVKCLAHNKRVPPRLFQAKNSKCIQAFLDGYSAGDGYIHNNYITTTCSVSFNLSIEVRDLALILGYQASINQFRDKNIWQVSWKNKGKMRAKNINGRYLIARPHSINHKQYNGLVYNLQVDKDESYSLIGFTVHNCRFQIIVKMPFQSLKDKLVSKRVYGSSIGSFWYASDASQEVVQATGRAVRSEDDWCVTYVLDKQAVDRVVNQRGLFPRYWLDACEV